ncbi:MAG: hypothetical protein C0412_20850 [Flavobacterium sp.]|nr:hypothetical protein [Flavobacterium sp.]
MKKYSLMAAILLAAISVSCEDSFSPKAPLNDEYALFCVLNADTTFQTVYLSRSYDVEGFDPYQNKTDPALEGAEVKFRVNNSTVCTLTEASTVRNDTSRYKSAFKYYFTNNLKPADNDLVEITAALRNGKILKATCKAPPISMLYFEGVNRDYFPSVNNPQSMDIVFGWQIMGAPLNPSAYYFLPQLELVYSKTDAPGRLYKVRVPKNISTSTGAAIEQTITSSKRAYYYYEAIIKALESISEGDPQKSKYIIHEAEFTLLFMDKNLASYSAAITTFRDEFSVRIDAADFSNIQNGLGLFGICTSKKAKVHMARTFINSFGYGTSYE